MQIINCAAHGNMLKFVFVCKRYTSTITKKYPFSDTIRTPQELLQELRNFAQGKLPNPSSLSSSIPYTKSQLESIESEFPYDLANDIIDVTLGIKPLVSVSTTKTFPFQCTSCGSCCRTHASTVLLDAYDIYKMTLSKRWEQTNNNNPAITVNKQTLLDYYPEGFRITLGQLSYHGLSLSIKRKYFRTEVPSSSLASKQLHNDQNNNNEEIIDQTITYHSPFNSNYVLPLRFYDGIVPIVFLATKKITLKSQPKATTNNKKKTTNKSKLSNNTISSTSTIDEQCTFAIPASSQSPSSSTKLPPLLCSLGPSSMPYACSLYPLGDFWTNSQEKFYSVDNKCEGIEINHISNNNTTTTDTNKSLISYIDRNSLMEYNNAAEWFRVLTTSYACSGIEEELGDIIEQLSTKKKIINISTNILQELPTWLYQEISTNNVRSQHQHQSSNPTIVPNTKSITIIPADNAIVYIRQELIKIWYKSIPIPNNQSSSISEWKDIQIAIEKETFTLYYRIQNYIKLLEKLL